MQIRDGTGKGYLAKVDAENRLETKATVQDRAAQISEENARAYVITVDDAGPVGGEYSIYIQNDSNDPFVIDEIVTANTDADVAWKLHEVTGTAAGASVLSPVNLNLTAVKVAELTCRGGAGGVTNLTSTNVIYAWYGGVARWTLSINLMGRLILGKDSAIAVEYDAGTGGAVSINIFGHFHNS